MTDSTDKHATGGSTGKPKPPQGTLNQTYDAANKVIDKTREVAVTVLDTTRDGAREAARRTAEGIEANPMAILVGGVALGVLAGALLPRSESEGKLLAPLGKRLTDTATVAIQAARDAGKEELGALGISRDAARDQAGKLVQGLLKALTTAGTAAVSATTAKAQDGA